MDSYLRRKQPYKSELANLNLVTNDTLPISTLHSQEKGEPDLRQQHSAPTTTDNFFLNGRKLQGRYKLHTEAMDLDSDYELDNAPVQAASRITRRHPVKIPFLTPSTSSSSSSRKTVSNNSNKLDPASPFYSTVVEPQMNLGQQWPPRSATFKRVVPGDNWHTAMTKKTAQVSLLKQMTAHLVNTYQSQNSSYCRKSTHKPQRILTKPSKGAKNDGYDNNDYDYILKVNDVLGEEKEYQYRIIDILGSGTFGQVVKCERTSTGELFSVKVIKNKVAYREQSRMEVEILKQLKSKLDSKAQRHILTLHHTFTHKNHFCLVFELLSFNLYELIKQNQFKGLSINLVRVFTLQLLDTLILLKEAKIIHCDLKPENVLLTSIDTPIIKVIDFGSACHEANKIYTYIQSRFYRSPEVLLGLQYTGAIDMWSLGCIVAELFIGIPLFPGSSEYNQLRRIVDMLGMPPQDMLEKGLNSGDFFNKDNKGNGKHVYTMKSLEQYGMEHKKTELPGKKYYPQTELPDLILETRPSHRSHGNAEQEHRRAMIDFLQGLLELNPLKRWTPQQARHHPFVTGQPFTEPYKPNNLARKQGTIVKKPTKSSTLPALQSSRRDPVTVRDTNRIPTSHHSNEQQHQNKIQPPESLGTGEHHDTNSTTNGPSYSRRPRAQSMNAPAIPGNIHSLVLDMQAHPIIEHHPAQQQSNSETREQQDRQHGSHDKVANNYSGFYKNRHSRSQGDLIGLLSPENHHPASSQQTDTTKHINNNISGISHSQSSLSVQHQQQSTDESTNTTPDDLLLKHTFYSESNGTTNDNDAIIVPTTLVSQQSNVRKVKIAPNVKIRIGSHEAYRQAGRGGGSGSISNSSSGSNSNNTSNHNDGLTTSYSNNNNISHQGDDGDWLTEPTITSLHLSSSARPKPKGRLSHEGEAAGGLLMMRQDKNDPFSSSSSMSNSKRVAAAIKRRTMLGN
ncbi:kinase-like domain-containing protein [Absidia repens]|uniref:Kinase-like domain-containing protein n=1 Tax=Absidia repens TaxID=90262 RepID=A0A1X2ISK6_9FUNG|nr:kinase-like domain-containing protein [Absidia repens]